MSEEGGRDGKLQEKQMTFDDSAIRHALEDQVPLAPACPAGVPDLQQAIGQEQMHEELRETVSSWHRPLREQRRPMLADCSTIAQLCRESLLQACRGLEDGHPREGGQCALLASASSV